MKLYLDTSTENTILRLDEKEYSAPLKNQLAEQIFTFIHDKLVENQADWTDLTEITFFAGPGSFTGLRIGGQYFSRSVANSFEKSRWGSGTDYSA